jgi:hypothetical protein
MLEESRYYLIVARDLDYGDVAELRPLLEDVSKLLAATFDHGLLVLPPGAATSTHRTVRVSARGRTTSTTSAPPHTASAPSTRTAPSGSPTRGCNRTRQARSAGCPS